MCTFPQKHQMCTSVVPHGCYKTCIFTQCYYMLPNRLMPLVQCKPVPLNLKKKTKKNPKTSWGDSDTLKLAPHARFWDLLILSSQIPFLPSDSTQSSHLTIQPEHLASVCQ